MAASAPTSPSAQSDAPPPAAAASVDAEALRRSHPLWERAAGRGGAAEGGRGGGQSGGRGAASDGGGGGGPGGDKPRFERLSQAALELAAFDGDGAESSIAASDVQTGARRARVSRRWRQKKRARAGEARAIPESPGARLQSDEDEDDEDDEEDEDDSDEADEADEGGGRCAAAKGGGGGGDDGRDRHDAMLAAAAFGGACDAAAASDADSSAGCSQTSSVRRDVAMRAAFPISGVSCVGCVLAGKVAPVVRFVNENAARMEETTLWKMAALAYQREVVEPARVEGVVVPSWGWREIRVHFQMHVVDVRLGRLSTLRLLGMMRTQAEQRLLRIEASGERELDKASAEEVRKIVGMESKERQLLEAMTAQGAGGRVKGRAKQGKGDE